MQLLEAHRGMFTDRPGRTQEAVIEIQTGEALPIHSPPYRLPHARKEMVQKEIQQMLRDDLIEPSTSAWVSPIVLVTKKDGSIRICVDYRKINAVTHPDPFPMPRIEEMIDSLAGARYLTTLDLTKGYWQVPVG